MASCLRVVFVAFLVGLLSFAPPAEAQRVRPRSTPRRSATLSIDNPMAGAFRTACNSVKEATAVVRCDGKDAALGAVVAPDGWIITKASELSGRITVQLRGERVYEAKLVGVSDDYDLAMLKINAAALTPVAWADAAKVSVGQLVATTGSGNLPVASGVISVGRRKLPSRNVALGVGLGNARGGVRVVQVAPDSGAAKAGIQVDDVILSIAGKRVATRDELVNIISERHLGEEVEVVLQRGDQQLTLSAILGTRPTTSPSRADVMNRLGGPLSRRSSGFPAVFQHDTILKPNQCGGPLIDIDGKVVGINIARAGRTESYAIPADVVQSLIPDLKAGKYPAKLPQLTPASPPPTSSRPKLRP